MRKIRHSKQFQKAGTDVKSILVGIQRTLIDAFTHTRTHAHTHTHTHMHTNTLTHTHTRVLSLSHTQSEMVGMSLEPKR